MAANDLDLNPEEYEILIADCDAEYADLKSKEMLLTIEMDALKRKMRHVASEKEYLMSLKSGTDWSDTGIAGPVKHTIIGTLTMRHQNLLAKRMKKVAGQ